MHHTQEYITRLMILLLYPILDNLAQRNVAGLVSLHYFAYSLVDNDDVIIFV